MPVRPMVPKSAKSLQPRAYSPRLRAEDERRGGAEGGEDVATITTTTATTMTSSG